MSKTKDTIETIASALAVIILIDMMGFAMWIMSNQYPADDFYIGTITAHALRLLP